MNSTSSRLYWLALPAILSILVLSICSCPASGSGDNGSAAQSPSRHVGNPEFQSAEMLPEGSAMLGQPVSFRAEISGSDPSAEVLVLLGGLQTVVSQLNDSGKSPDQAAADGIWTGTLDWSKVTKSAAGLPLRFEYRVEGRVVTSTNLKPVDITANGQEFLSMDCQPSGTLEPGTELLLTAELGIGRRSGQVLAGFGETAELELNDMGKDGDKLAGDGIYSLLAAVPVDLPYGNATKMHVRYVEDAVQLAAATGPEIVLNAPPSYITGLSTEPAGTLQVGEPYTVTVQLNPGSEATDILLEVRDEGNQHTAELATLSHGGNGSFSRDQWSWEAGWPLKWMRAGGSYTLLASIRDADGRIVSRRALGPLIAAADRLAIGECSLDPGQPLLLGEFTLMDTRTNKSIEGSYVSLFAGDLELCRMADNGPATVQNVPYWVDRQAGDALYTGAIEWRAIYKQVDLDKILEGRLEWRDQSGLLAEKELDGIVIRKPELKLGRFYFDPGTPLELGGMALLVVEMNHSMVLGRMDFLLPDGTLVGSHKFIGNLGVTQLDWTQFTKPGRYGPFTARCYDEDGNLLDEIRSGKVEIVDPGPDGPKSRPVLPRK